MIEQIQQTAHKAEGSISYGLGCASVFLGWVCDASDLFQALAIFLGCLLVAIRMVIDIHKYIIFLKNNKGNEEESE